MAPPVVTAAVVASTPGPVGNSSVIGSSSQAHSRSINITEETLKLIDCVKARPALWHRKHLRQRVQVAHRGWEEIRQSFNSADVSSLKTRWKTLRDSFRREVKRIEDGEQATSTWPLYDTMSFLLGHFRTRDNYYPAGSQSPEESSKTADEENWQYLDGKHDSSNNDEEPTQTVGCSVEAIESIYPETKRGRYDSGATAKYSSLAEESDPEDLIAGDNFQTVSQPESYENLELETARSCEVIELPPQIYREVTFKNRLRARIKTEPVELEDKKSVKEAIITPDSDYNFLMSLHPFMRQLSGKKNLSLRIQIQQMIANALDED
ncbi:uncharacterized protein LOC129723509 [Wyeomyia smithii]|uniref:uncharacterized protein LOC129723509 n=1 Tax=Wyeomyia smithii TaxID=174621 RepID=UPI002467D1C1|nr:uncharacterized protein LOC129723509 [Wyeomyia smithii]